MADEIRNLEKQTEILRARNEEKDQELSLAQKEAAIREAKRTYGKDWRKMIGGAFKHIKVNPEALQNLHALGVGDPELRNLSNPAFLNRHK